MDKQNKMLEMNFSEIPETITDARIDGQIMLFDNFGRFMDPELRKLAEGYCFPTHTDITIIILCTKGETRIKVNLKEESVQQNNVLIILPGCIFEINYISQDFEGAVMLLDSNVMLLNEDAVLSMSLRRYLSSHHNMLVSSDNIDYFKNLYCMIKHALQEKENVFRSQIVSKFCQILVYSACHIFLQSPPKGINQENNRKQEIFDKFIRVVESYYMKEHRIKFYADAMCLSAKYLSSVIKEVSGKYASDWVDEYIILEAKALLKQKGINIQMVSDKLNFPNQSFFGRYFKQHTGYSPKAYKKL